MKKTYIPLLVNLIRVLSLPFLILGLLLVFEPYDHYFPIDIFKPFFREKLYSLNLYKYFFYPHIILAPISIIIGTILIIFNSFSLRTGFHIIGGKIYVVTTILANIAGFGMGFWAIGGSALTVNFILLSTVAIYFTLNAFIAIKNKNLNKHKTNMRRSYILMLSALVLRYFLSFKFLIFLENSEIRFLLVNLLSWVLPLMIFEVYKYYERK